MVAPGEQFGRAVLAIEADDSGLREALKRSEAIVRASAAKMESDLKPLAVGQQEVAGSASAASAAVATLGATASLTGNQMLATTTQVGGLAAALISQAAATTSATTAIKTMTKASLAFLATPIGVALVALAGIIALVTLAWTAHNKEAKEAEERLKAAAGAADDHVTALTKENAAIERQIAINEGALASDLDIAKAREERAARANELQQIQIQGGSTEQVLDATLAESLANRKISLLITKQQIDATNKLEAAEAAARDSAVAAFIAQDLAALAKLDSQEAINEALRQEIEILDEVAVATDFILDKTQQQLTIDRNAARERKNARELDTGGRLAFGPQALQTFQTVSLSQTALGGPGANRIQRVSDEKTQKGLKKVEQAVKAGGGGGVPRVQP